MNRLSLLALNAIVAGFALFCIFGFLASGEPGVSATWRVAYATLGTLSIGALVYVNACKRK